jgi:hypothetical protein
MDPSERNLLIDYMLGRLSSEEAAALEERMRVDPELADAFAELTEAKRFEGNISVSDVSARRLAQRLNSLLRDEKDEASSSSPELEGEVADDEADFAKFSGSLNEDEAISASEDAVAETSRHSSRQFAFIPKIVEAPHRSEPDGLVLKRALEISPEEAARRRAEKQLLRRGLSFFAFSNEDIRLVSAISDVELTESIQARTPRLGTTLFTERNSFDDICYSSDWRRIEAPALVIKRNRLRGIGRLHSVDAYGRKSSDFSLRPRPVDEADLYLSQRGGFFSSFQVSSGIPISSEGACVFPERAFFRFVPLEYFDGQTTYRQIVPQGVARAASFGLSSVASGKDAKRVDGTSIVSLEKGFERMFGSSASQGPRASYSIGLDEDLAIGPTLSAEDRYLAELLGRIPTAVELDEFYWEEVDEKEAPKLSSAVSKFYKAALVITEPPVLIGRAAINFFYALWPRGFSRGEDFKETRLRRKNNKSYLSDMMISTIAGVLIAVCFIFPALRYVVHEIYTTVAESRVRKLGENVVLTPQETGEVIIPVIEGLEHVFYPKYSPDQPEPAESNEEL